MRTNAKSIRAYAKHAGYTHFEATTGGCHLFSTHTCDVCKCDVEAPNGVLVTNTTADICRKAGLVDATNAMPTSGGYSELHSGATCDACCYDPNAGKTADPTDAWPVWYAELVA